MKESHGGSRFWRIAGVCAVALVAVAAFATAGIAGKKLGTTQHGPGLAQYQYGKKVTVCHKGKRSIRISVNALPAHLRHGDAAGPCANGTVAAKRAAQAAKKAAKQAAKAAKKAGGQGAASGASAAPGNGNGKSKHGG